MYYHDIPDRFKEYKSCITCQQQYRDIDNIGLLKCSIHPGILETNTTNNTIEYTCCGLSPTIDNQYTNFVTQNEAMGCVKCDHTSIDFGVKNKKKRLNNIRSWCTIVIPYLLYDFGMHQPDKSCILIEVNRDALKDIKHNTNGNDNDSRCVFNINTLLVNIEDSYYSHIRTSGGGGGDNGDDRTDIKINIMHISNDLYKGALESNYFKEYIGDSFSIKENITETQCDSIWIGKLPKELDSTLAIQTSLQERLKNKNRKTWHPIPFKIIIRIDNKLDTFLLDRVRNRRNWFNNPDHIKQY